MTHGSESGSNRSNRGGVYAEQKRTENRTLGTPEATWVGAEELFLMVIV